MPGLSMVRTHSSEQDAVGACVDTPELLLWHTCLLAARACNRAQASISATTTACNIPLPQSLLAAAAAPPRTHWPLYAHSASDTSMQLAQEVHINAP